MTETKLLSASTLPRDFLASIVVLLVALPLCLGIALASNAPLISGVIAGIVGGILVGALSGSHTSVTGPAAGLTAIVAAQIAALGSFQTFLLAIMVAGVIQILAGVFRAGFLAAFFPSSVIKGLLAAIGVILILKQIPHLLGHDADPEGEMAFRQPNAENTFSELGQLLGDIHPGAAIIGLSSLALLLVWDKVKLLKKSWIPAPLIVALLGVGMMILFRRLGDGWTIGASHLVQVPVAEDLAGVLKFLQSPDFSQWKNPAVYSAGFVIALVASLETLLNLEAIDKLDPWQRTSPPNRELMAQGVGNLVAGLLGGIPVTSVIVRSSVNINSGGRTKLVPIFQGCLMLGCVILLPAYLNMIPLSCLAAILVVTGIKLASPQLVRKMWNDGRYQFVPFVITVLAIVFTDLLNGILVGLAVSLGFILNSNLRRPTRRVLEKHLGGDVLHIELANQVSFLNRAALSKILDDVPRGGHVLLDAHQTDYIDPDVLEMIREYSEKSAPARGVQVSLRGFRDKYRLEDRIQFMDYSTRELQSKISPQQVLQILKEGHERFRSGQRLTRDLGRQVQATADGQHPLAVILSCIDSRTPTEIIFDLGVGDTFSVRLAGNTISRKALGSMEYACAVAGAKLVLVMGHTRCGAVTAAVSLAGDTKRVEQVTGCQHLGHIVTDIQRSVDRGHLARWHDLSEKQRQSFVDEVARANVARTVRSILEQSSTLSQLVREGRIAIVGAMYDVVTGDLIFLQNPYGTDAAKSGDEESLIASST